MPEETVDHPTFVYLTCQRGAETALKHEVARRWPTFRFAFSRPGFLTFKVPPDAALEPNFDLKLVFARAQGISLGKVDGDSPAALAEGVWRLLGKITPERIHVWQREVGAPAEEEPTDQRDAEVEAARAALLATAPRATGLSSDHGAQSTKPGHLVLDVILMESGQWWVGYHVAQGIASCFPGGRIELRPPADMVSRAWLKMEEALRWSDLPIPVGARCVEIGSAPGGASQALLSHGLEVTGVDPAAMDHRILAHSHFTHVRRRANQVRRREFRKVRWLTADMNVAPSYTLEVVESIVTHPEVSIRGMLITLKLFEWELADEVPAMLKRIRSWGYNIVRARQLWHNRQEICVAALQKPFLRKPPSR